MTPGLQSWEKKGHSVDEKPSRCPKSQRINPSVLKSRVTKQLSNMFPQKASERWFFKALKLLVLNCQAFYRCNFIYVEMY